MNQILTWLDFNWWRCLQAWPWLDGALIAILATGLVLLGLYFALHMWLVWREARLYYAARRQVWPRLWPEQRIWGSEEL